MSYLIALYVYYHGNNLAVFGITKGARDEDLNNKGLKRPEEINPDLVDQQLIKSAQEEEEKQIETDKELNWNDILRSSIQKAQKMTYELQYLNLHLILLLIHMKMKEVFLWISSHQLMDFKKIREYTELTVYSLNSYVYLSNISLLDLFSFTIKNIFFTICFNP